MSGKKDKSKEFKSITTAKGLEEHFHNSGFGHTHYSHYTKITIVNDILRNNEFWMGCAADCNDENDRQQFGNDQRLYFTVCFCAGTTENIPLWYLYSDIHGKGARLNFTKTAVQDLIRNSRFELVDLGTDGKGNEKVCDLVADGNKKPSPGATMQWWFRDVMYERQIKENRTLTNKVRIESNGFVLKEISKKAVDDYKAGTIGFAKGEIWAYEKECRLLVKLRGKAAETVKNSDHKFRIVIHFNESVKEKVDVTFGPNVEEKDIHDKYAKLDGFFSLVMPKLQTSNYAGTVKMNVCPKCDYKEEKEEKKEEK